MNNLKVLYVSIKQYKSIMLMFGMNPIDIPVKWVKDYPLEWGEQTIL